MTYKEILLGVAEFQRAVLDIHAWINFVEVYQSCLFSGPNGMVKYKANQDLMGAFTEKVQVAQQLLAMGIPVWLICPSFRILPTMNVYIPSPQLHCEKIVLEYFKDGAGNSDPYPVLATGPPSSKLYRWTQNIGCGIMDLQNITAIGRQDFIKGKASIGGVRDECMFSACNDATHLTTPNEDSIPVLPTSALHSDTVFVPEKYIMEMKALVETVRPEKSKGKAKASVLPDEQPAEDSYEPGMKVPVSALEGCLASFIAADERRTKASTQFFADTGLMAMLCHHDHVLSLVNMTSAVEGAGVSDSWHISNVEGWGPNVKDMETALKDLLQENVDEEGRDDEELNHTYNVEEVDNNNVIEETEYMAVSHAFRVNGLAFGRWESEDLWEDMEDDEEDMLDVGTSQKRSRQKYYM
ncbi:hypothetical protein K443DRAFT_4157 [Laccaria amethystina LaAM-08-1]|uniref:Uncharacterized protein n=1 Tax=Laccaria amethystina LaAM-08-1 TaxID=1095629 RepID=A0A0C9YAD7_9AGAR|nr:hypothetical protein K443DRAFT_4157 [Laccaria amethystina LaAM-08-1]